MSRKRRNMRTKKKEGFDCFPFFLSYFEFSDFPIATQCTSFSFSYFLFFFGILFRRIAFRRLTLQTPTGEVVENNFSHSIFLFSKKLYNDVPLAPPFPYENSNLTLVFPHIPNFPVLFRL